MPRSGRVTTSRTPSVRFGVLLITLIAAPSPATTEPDAWVGRWEGAITHHGRAWRIAFDAWRDSGRLVGSLDFPDAGRYALPLDELSLGKGGSVRLQQGQRRAAVSIEARKSNGQIVGTWEGFGVRADLVLTRTSFVPHRFVEVPLRFRSDGVTLAGTLVKPPTPGPHPVIVWTHGSGFIGRQSDPYRMLGYLFARHGVAALLYDKRGVEASTGSFRDATLDDLADDALAAVAMLRERNDIDASRIGIGGHSQGGWIAPLAASRSDQIALVVVIAAAGMSPVEQGSFLIENRLRDAGHDDAAIEQATQLRSTILRYLRTGEDHADLERRLTDARREPWYREALLPPGSLNDFRERTPDWLSLDPAPLWERIDVPVWAVWGEKDRVVPSRRSYELIEAALRRGGNDRTTLVMLPDADHNLLLVSEDENDGDWPRIAPDLEKHIAEWSARFTKPAE